MTANFKFSGNFGDVIASIPAMDKYYRLFSKRIILYSHIGIRVNYYDGAIHPVQNDNGQQVMMTLEMMDMLRPLLLEQSCIEEFKAWDGEEIKIDFDKLYTRNVNKPYGSINRWPFYLYPNLSTDLSGKWLNVPDSKNDLAKGKVLVTRTHRYNNPLISYFFLRPFQDHLMFAGTKEEHEKFMKDFNLDFPRLEISNFLELAQSVKQSRFLLSNQTAIFQIAEGIKKPRILEICSLFPNVIPIGKKAYDIFEQMPLEHHFNELFNETI